MKDKVYLYDLKRQLLASIRIIAEEYEKDDPDTLECLELCLEAIYKLRETADVLRNRVKADE